MVKGHVATLLRGKLGPAAYVKLHCVPWLRNEAASLHSIAARLYRALFDISQKSGRGADRVFAGLEVSCAPRQSTGTNSKVARMVKVSSCIVQ